jgi:hypothetical protein
MRWQGHSARRKRRSPDLPAFLISVWEKAVVEEITTLCTITYMKKQEHSYEDRV